MQPFRSLLEHISFPWSFYHPHGTSHMKAFALSALPLFNAAVRSDSPPWSSLSRGAILNWNGRTEQSGSFSEKHTTRLARGRKRKFTAWQNVLTASNKPASSELQVQGRA